MQPSPDEAIPAFMIAVATGIVLGVAVLLLIYKMVDKDLPAGAGLGALVMIFLAMALAIKPPHPAVPGAVLLISVTLMIFFPFAAQKLEEFELRGIDADRMIRCLEAVRVRPDNFAARFELAKMLHEHGFRAHAIHLAAASLAELDTQRDPIRNQSLRDVFHREAILLHRWQQEPPGTQVQKCQGCGVYNQAADLFCTGCQRPYLTDIVMSQDVKSRVWTKLVLAWTSIGLFVPAAIAISMNLTGVLQVLAFGAGLTLVGILMAWLFRTPKHARPLYD